MTEPLPETRTGAISARAARGEFLERLLDRKTVVAVGPGIGTHPETVKFVQELLRACTVPLVLDADALNGLADKLQILRAAAGRQIVITPHPGEMARLLNSSPAEVERDRIGVARRFAQERGLTVVLKGNRTLVAEPEGRVWVNTTGNPAMAKGGVGDVLTGMTAGFLAQQRPPLMALDVASGATAKRVFGKMQGAASEREGMARLTAAERIWLKRESERVRTALAAQNKFRRVAPVLAAVHLHGLAGDLARDAADESTVLATDLLTALAAAFQLARDRAQQEFVVIR